MKVKHLIGIYFGMGLIGLGISLLWHTWAMAIYSIVIKSPSLALVYSTNTGSWLRFLVTFIGNLFMVTLIAVGLMIAWDWRVTIPVLLFNVGQNGFSLGVFGGLAAQKYGTIATAGAILTHGIPELISYFIAYGACIYGLEQLRDAKGANMVEVLKKNSKTVLGICLPLLLVAAILETFVSPLILGA